MTYNVSHDWYGCNCDYISGKPRTRQHKQFKYHMSSYQHLITTVYNKRNSFMKCYSNQFINVYCIRTAIIINT